MMHKLIGGVLAVTVFVAGSLIGPHPCNAQSPSSVPIQNQAAASQTEASAASPSSRISEVDQLRKQIQEQQKQIEQLQGALANQQQLLERLARKDEAAQTAGLPARASSEAIARSKAAPDQQPLIATTGAPSLATASESNPLQVEQNPAIPNSPVMVKPLKIGGATLTPVGFVDATAFFRTRNLGSGIGASFGSLPFSNTVAGSLSETRLTIQNSRFGLQYDSHFGGNQVRGYMETDFLGAQPTNAFVTSNSDSLRMRLYWVDGTRGKFEFLSGQSWSLLTPGRNGISPVPSDIFYTQDMDTNYQVGLTWSRQLQFRFVYHASPAVTAALSLENPQQYVGGAVTLPGGFNTGQVDQGANTAAPNVFPDVIGKLAFDPHVAGKHMHLEFAGLLSTFRTLNASTNAKNTIEGGGGSFNFNLELFKNFHLVESSFYSSGGGRYIFGLGPDFIVRPDSTPSPVNADSGIGGFEYQFAPKTMFYGYYGGAYFGRNFSVIPSATGGTPTYVGYGYPGSSNAANRTVQEGTLGWIQTLWRRDRYGALQLITQYSYLTRAPWYVAPGSSKHANLSEVYADIRYVLP